MVEMKYVVVKTADGGEQMFIFPKSVDHNRFTEVLSYIKEGDLDWKRPLRTPISAGFTDGRRCYGQSESLRLASRKCDAELLTH